MVQTPSEKALKIRETLNEVRFALASLPPEDRRSLIEDREALRHSSWRTHSRTRWDR